MVSMADRRRHGRNPINWPVSLYHPRLGRFINCRSVDVSQSGARISLPIGVPIHPGQVVELNFPRTSTLAKVAGCFSRIKTAVVVRVEREAAPADPADHAAFFAHALGTLPYSVGSKYSPAIPALAPAAASLATRRPARQTVAVYFDKNALSMIH